MNEIIRDDFQAKVKELYLSNSEYLCLISQEFERDSRRYNRAFSEESEAGVV